MLEPPSVTVIERQAEQTAKARPAVEIMSVVKRFGDGPGAVTALDRVSLTIRDNEFFTLLGPSGCGKTTLLRLIAGFEAVSEGEIFLYGEEIEGLPPNRRPVNTVFQHYALFPHMSVAENVAFALQRLKRPAEEIGRRVEEMLSLVQLSAMAGRRPSQLSGGQQQRVALARALAPHPKVLLLDEPLSALDLKLRQAMRVELKQIQEETGITFVFVTHDQEEALTMSDRLAVMSNGLVQQVGTASEIYERPVNRFVADFIGDTNLVEVTIEDVEKGQARCRTAGGTLLECPAPGSFRAGETVQLSIRPERLALVEPETGNGALPCRVERLMYLGTDTQYRVALDEGTRLRVRVQNAHDAAVPFGPGERAALKLDPGAARLLAE